MPVFISHSSKDKPAVEALAAALQARGIDPWLDSWEIGADRDIVANINAGLEKAGTGIIVFSEHSRESRWVDAEGGYWTYARIEEGKVLIPVVLGKNYFIPPLLRPLARHKIEEVDAIADALLHRSAKPSLARPPEQGRVEQVLVTLRRNADADIRVETRIGSQSYGEAGRAAIPSGLVAPSAALMEATRRNQAAPGWCRRSWARVADCEARMMVADRVRSTLVGRGAALRGGAASFDAAPRMSRCRPATKPKPPRPKDRP